MVTGTRISTRNTTTIIGTTTLPTTTIEDSTTVREEVVDEDFGNGAPTVRIVAAAAREITTSIIGMVGTAIGVTEKIGTATMRVGTIGGRMNGIETMVSMETTDQSEAVIKGMRAGRGQSGM